MSELDVAKEKIAYLKVWLGILVVTNISTFGWLISNVESAIEIVVAVLLVIVALVFVGIAMDAARFPRERG